MASGSDVGVGSAVGGAVTAIVGAAVADDAIAEGELPMDPTGLGAELVADATEDGSGATDEFPIDDGTDGSAAV
jgi:hypothetical protein